MRGIHPGCRLTRHDPQHVTRHRRGRGIGTQPGHAAPLQVNDHPVIHRRQPPLLHLHLAPERHHLIIGRRGQIDLLKTIDQLRELGPPTR